MNLRSHLSRPRELIQCLQPFNIFYQRTVLASFELGRWRPWFSAAQGPFLTVQQYYNCLVLGHTKCNGVQRVYCNKLPAKPFYGSHRLDLVMIRPPRLDHWAFVVSPDSVWYALVLLLFSATSQTNTGSKTFDCALLSTLETYDDPASENGNYCQYC